MGLLGGWGPGWVQDTSAGRHDTPSAEALAARGTPPPCGAVQPELLWLVGSGIWVVAFVHPAAAQDLDALPCHAVPDDLTQPPATLSSSLF